MEKVEFQKTLPKLLFFYIIKNQIPILIKHENFNNNETLHQIASKKFWGRINIIKNNIIPFDYEKFIEIKEKYHFFVSILKNIYISERHILYSNKLELKKIIDYKKLSEDLSTIKKDEYINLNKLPDNNYYKFFFHKLYDDGIEENFDNIKKFFSYLINNFKEIAFYDDLLEFEIFLLSNKEYFEFFKNNLSQDIFSEIHILKNIKAHDLRQNFQKQFLKKFASNLTSINNKDSLCEIYSIYVLLFLLCQNKEIKDINEINKAKEFFIDYLVKNIDKIESFEKFIYFNFNELYKLSKLSNDNEYILNIILDLNYEKIFLLKSNEDLILNESRMIDIEKNSLIPNRSLTDMVFEYIKNMSIGKIQNFLNELSI